MIRYRAVLLLLLCIPLLAGCWDRMEVNDLAIVDLVGVDAAEEGLRLTVTVVVPTRAQISPSAGGGGAGGEGPPAVIYSAEGESVMNAMMKIQERLSRRLFWAHVRALIIGEEFARSGVRPALDFWSRHREPRLIMQVAVTPGQASDFLAASPRLERLLSEAVRETINMRMQVKVTMKDFLGSLRSETEEPIAPRVQLVSAEGGQDAEVSGTALFQDDRLVGWLGDSETRGLLWLRGEITTGVATVDVPSGGKVSMMLIRARTSTRPDFSTGRLRMIVEIVAEDDVYESSAPLDLGKEETVLFVEELLRKDIQQRARETVERVQREFAVDVFNFGDAVRRAAPLRWEGGLKQRWAEVFPNLPVEIVVSAHVRRTGEHSAPLGAEKEQIKSDPKALRKTGE